MNLYSTLYVPLNGLKIMASVCLFIFLFTGLTVFWYTFSAKNIGWSMKVSCINGDASNFRLDWPIDLLSDESLASVRL